MSTLLYVLGVNNTVQRRPCWLVMNLVGIVHAGDPSTVEIVRLGYKEYKHGCC